MAHAFASPLILAAVLAAVPAVASAQDQRVPYAGADLAYDYLTGEYYRYEGPRQQDPRAREQTGYRDGSLHTPPNYGYYAGVKWIGGRAHHRGCGCSAYYGRRSHAADYDYDYDDTYQPSTYSNSYGERYASSNNKNWGYNDHRYGGWGY